MWCVASHPPPSSVVDFFEPNHPDPALGGLGAHDERTSAGGESSAPGQESMVVPPASTTSGAAASPKRSTPSVTPLASTVVMGPVPLRRGRRALRTGPRSVPSRRSFPRVHPPRATAKFVYRVHKLEARVRLTRGFHNGLVGVIR